MCESVSVCVRVNPCTRVRIRMRTTVAGYSADVNQRKIKFNFIIFLDLFVMGH